MDDFAIPRILVVVLIPETPEDWFTQSETETLHQKVRILDLAAGKAKNTKHKRCHRRHPQNQPIYSRRPSVNYGGN